MGRIIGGILVFMIAVGLFAGAFFTTRATLNLRATGLRAEGTVTDLERETKTEDGKTTTMYKPVVEFTAASGKTVKFKSATSSSSPSYGRGDRVPVLYPEQAPEK